MSRRKNISKTDEAIFDIIGQGGATYDHIKKSLASMDIIVTCLAGKMQSLVVSGQLSENLFTGEFKMGLEAPLILKCLCCGKSFRSESKKNHRLCDACRTKY